MAERLCGICGGSMAGRSPLAKTCAAHECQRANRRVNERAARARRGVVTAPKREVKHCPACDRDLPAEAFGPNRRTADGLQSYCKGCRSDYSARPDQREKDARRKHLWHMVHRSETLARQRARWRLDPARRERLKKANLARYYADPKAVIDRRREMRQAQRQRDRDAEARRCVCGRGLAEGQWFCRVECKARASATVAETLAAGLG